MKFLIFIIMTLLGQLAEARDFGVQGHVFEILEENILEVIKKSLQKIDLTKLQRDMKEQTEKYIQNPKPVEDITYAKESKVYHYDPTYTLKEDIKDHTGKLIHASGTQVNPLEHMSLSEGLIFIDGDNDRQLQFALKTWAEKAGKLKIVLVKGMPPELQKKHKVWIYFDQQGVLTKQLGIREIPALVEQDALKLKISIFEAEKL